jgi:hypothetical protein
LAWYLAFLAHVRVRRASFANAVLGFISIPDARTKATDIAIVLYLRIPILLLVVR